jgi:non-heme chloroperoxidase
LTSTAVPATQITEREAMQIARANESALTPVVFVHGLWLLSNSWDRWVALFEEAGPPSRQRRTK